MKKLIKLNYHSVFKYENDKESFKYNGAAFLEELDDKTIISYEDKTKIKFILKKDEVFLHNDASVLHLHKNRVILNHYQTEYGILKLQTRLINYEYDNTDEHIIMFKSKDNFTVKEVTANYDNKKENLEYQFENNTITFNKVGTVIYSVIIEYENGDIINYLFV